MSKRSNTQEFIARAKIIHNNIYDYSLVEYITSNKKVKIFCKKHKIYFLQAPHKHLSGQKCKKCSIEIITNKTRYTKKEILKRFKDIHKNKYDYSNIKYINILTKIKIFCKKHKKSFYITPYNHLVSKFGGCVICTTDHKKELYTKTFTIKKFLNKINKIHYKKYKYINLPKIIKLKEKIKIKCLRCNKKFTQLVYLHLNGCGCKSCSMKKAIKKYKFKLKDLIKKALKLHNNKYNYNLIKNYIDCDHKVPIFCKNHGIFYMSFYSHINQNHRCPKCTHRISKIEELWLTSMKIKNDRFHRQVKLIINNKIFKVDGFDIKNNTIYEFFGDYYHGNPDIYNLKNYNKKCKKTFGDLYDRTIERINLFKNNGYKINFIWENDYRKQLKLINRN